MRYGTVIAGCAAVLTAAAGCGTEEPTARRPAKAVRLQISAPVDSAIVRGSATEVRGRVSPPSALVRVQGRSARVRGGTFMSLVPLAQGPNVIDVAATARGRSATLTAFRVIREVRVTVPDLKGVAVGDAGRKTARLGLRLESERGGGLLDPLVPRGLAVCDQAPAAGTEVRHGTTVRVVAARSC